MTDQFVGVKVSQGAVGIFEHNCFWCRTEQKFWNEMFVPQTMVTVTKSIFFIFFCCYEFTSLDRKMPPNFRTRLGRSLSQNRLKLLTRSVQRAEVNWSHNADIALFYTLQDAKHGQHILPQKLPREDPSHFGEHLPPSLYLSPLGCPSSSLSSHSLPLPFFAKTISSGNDSATAAAEE